MTSAVVGKWEEWGSRHETWRRPSLPHWEFYLLNFPQCRMKLPLWGWLGISFSALCNHPCHGRFCNDWALDTSVLKSVLVWLRNAFHSLLETEGTWPLWSPPSPRVPNFCISPVNFQKHLMYQHTVASFSFCQVRILETSFAITFKHFKEHFNTRKGGMI